MYCTLISVTTAVEDSGHVPLIELLFSTSSVVAVFSLATSSNYFVPFQRSFHFVILYCRIRKSEIAL